MSGVRDKSDSFMRKVTKGVSELIPGTMNILLSESQSGNDLSLRNESNDQPPVKKLCTSNNTFSSVNNRTYVDTNLPRSSVNNHKNQPNINAVLSEISVVNCVPNTSSRESSKLMNQSSPSLICHDATSNSSLKRKSEMIDLSNIKRPNLNFNFASSTPTVTTNKLSINNINLKNSLNTEKLSMSHESLISTLPKLTPRENDQSLLLFPEKTSKKSSSPSYRWDTFVDYGELSERQKLFISKSPLNCSQIMYRGSSAHSNLSKILGSTPPIKKKVVIQISPTNNNKIRTTSSIILERISTKDKKFEKNRCIIQPKSNLRHKAEPETLPITEETTIKSIDTVSEKSINTSRDISRKLRANTSKKIRGLTSEEYEMPSKVDLPNITLPVPILPRINLFNNCKDNEFTFNQPLTLEQFSLQKAEKISRKTQKITSLRTINSDTDSNNENNLCPTVIGLTHNISIDESKMKEFGKVSISNEVENLRDNDKIFEIPKYENDFKNSISQSLENSSSKLVTIKSNETLKLQESNNTNKESERSSVDLKKWVCYACWVSNDSEKNNCVACQTPKYCKSQKPLKIVKSSIWTCATCWFPNKNELTSCASCQKQKPESFNKVLTQSSTWTCDVCCVKNKIECTSCVSCGTVIGLENKAHHPTQFEFKTNNNTFENSTSEQFKFGSNNNKIINNVTNQFKFDSPTFNNSGNDKSVDTAAEFKFGMVNNKTDELINTFKFNIDNLTSQQEKQIVDVLNNSNTEQPKSQFNFGFEKKLDQSESPFNFGLNASTSSTRTCDVCLVKNKIECTSCVSCGTVFGLENKAHHSTQFEFKTNNNTFENSTSEQFKFGSNNNKIKNVTNQLKFESPTFNDSGNDKSVDTAAEFKFGMVNNKTDELFNTFKFNIDNLTSQPEKQIVDVSNNSNTEQPKCQFNFGFEKKLDQSEIPFNFGLNAKEKVIQNPIHFGNSQTVQYTISNANELPNDQKMHNPFTFRSATNDNPYVLPTINCFPNTGPGFGTNTSNTMFGTGHTILTPSTLNLSVPTPQCSFRSIAPSTTTNSIFFMTSKDNDKTSSAQTITSFTSPTFNDGGFIKSTQDDQSINKSNNLYNPSNSRQIIKSTDSKEPISINFTSGAISQFTDKSETIEPPIKRKKF